jgi:HEAT repeat protein
MTPRLIKRTEDPEWFVRHEAIEALSYVKGSKEAAAAVAARLKDDSIKALPAINRMGPIAEDAVLAELAHADVHEIDYCLEALEAVGTVKSLEILRPYIRSKNFLTRTRVQSTVRAIQIRRAAK